MIKSIYLPKEAYHGQYLTVSLCSGLNSGVEESVNVDDVLEESPFGSTGFFIFCCFLNFKIVVDGLINLSSHGTSLGYCKSISSGEEGNNGKGEFEHFFRV